MKIAIVDLGSQWTHRIWRTLKYLNVDANIVPCETPVGQLDVDALMLSGGPVRLGKGEEEIVGNAHKYLDEFDRPILGLCAGHQFIGLHFGGKARPSAGPEFGKVELIVDEHDDLFAGLPEKFTVWASHNDEIVDVPGFKVLAHSEKCANHAMKAENKPIYGCLFHPEVEHTEHGAEVYKNFLEVCKR